MKFSSIKIGSMIFTEILVSTELLVTIFGRWYHFTTVTWILIFDKITENMSLIASDLSIPTK